MSFDPWGPGVRIAPSILSADFARLGEEIEAIEAAGADWVHVDVMDGHFVPNLTIGPVVVKALRPHVKTVIDAHLMIAPADPYLAAFAEAGADQITIHAEVSPHLDRSLAAIRDLGCRVGVSITPSTPPETAPLVAQAGADSLVAGSAVFGGGPEFYAARIAAIRAAAEGALRS